MTWRDLGLALLALASLALPAVAVDAHQLFDSGTADAMKVEVDQVQGDNISPIDATHEFHAGDKIRLVLESNFPGFVYVVNRTPGGETRVLLPATAQPDNSIAPKREQVLPAPPTLIQFDTETGTEILRVIMSRHRLPLYEKAMAANHGILQGPDIVSEAEAHAHRESSGVVMLQITRPTSMWAQRGLDLTATHEASATYVAMRPLGGTVSSDHRISMGPMDVGIFEIRLHHL